MPVKERNYIAVMDRIDEEHFELRLHAQALEALQRRVNLLEAELRDLRRDLDRGDPAWRTAIDLSDCSLSRARPPRWKKSFTR